MHDLQQLSVLETVLKLIVTNVDSTVQLKQWYSKFLMIFLEKYTYACIYTTMLQWFWGTALACTAVAGLWCILVDLLFVFTIVWLSSSILCFLFCSALLSSIHKNVSLYIHLGQCISSIDEQNSTRHPGGSKHKLGFAHLATKTYVYERQFCFKNILENTGNTFNWLLEIFHQQSIINVLVCDKFWLVKNLKSGFT